MLMLLAVVVVEKKEGGGQSVKVGRLAVTSEVIRSF